MASYKHNIKTKTGVILAQEIVDHLASDATIVRCLRLIEAVEEEVAQDTEDRMRTQYQAEIDKVRSKYGDAYRDIGEMASILAETTEDMKEMRQEDEARQTGVRGKIRGWLLG